MDSMSSSNFGGTVSRENILFGFLMRVTRECSIAALLGMLLFFLQSVLTGKGLEGFSERQWLSQKQKFTGDRRSCEHCMYTSI